MAEHAAKHEPAPDVSFASPPTLTPEPGRPSTGDHENTVPGTIPPLADLPTPAGYTVFEVLGRGGMGVVYKARQASLNRVVALKMILSGGHAHESELARFRVEAEAIARIQHPHIVQVFEVGTASGQPYFTLEFCEGGGLNRKLAGTPLAPPEASALVQKLALAMHAAHQKGVLHRDLKPANVLLTGDGTPKITDFGLAKLDQQDLASASAILGTPSYMAPEQAWGRNRDLTPACDIYSLGAVLYECLTGRPPFRSDSNVETLRQVIQDDPVAPRSLNPRVPRDLETICLKCLAKREDRRYATARDLADDLRRFEAGEVILARRAGGLERAARWVRRRPTQAALLGMVAVSAALLAVAAVGFTRRLTEERNAAVAAQELAEEEKARADAQRDKAEAEARKVQEVRRLFRSMFTAADPIGMDTIALSGLRDGTAPYTTRELVERASRQLELAPIRDPEVRAEMADTLGDLHRSLGRLDKAEKWLQEGLNLRRQRLPPDHPDLATSLHHMGWLRHEQGRYEEAERLYRQALAIRSNRLPPDSPEVSDSQLHLAWLAIQADDLGSAERQFLALFERRKGALGEDHRDTAIARIGLVAVYLQSGRFDAAMIHLPALSAYVKHAAADNKIDGGVEKLQQGVVFWGLDKHTLAIGKFREALAVVSAQLGPDHVYTALVHFQLALSLEKAGQPAEAEKHYRHCLAIARERVGFEHPKAIPLIGSYAGFLRKQDRAPEARALLAELVAAQRGRHDGRFLPDALCVCGQFHESLGETSEALSSFREALDLYRKSGGPTRHLFSTCLNRLGCVYSRTGRHAATEELFREVVPLVRKQFGPAHANTGIALTNLADSRLELGKLGGVEGLLLEARKIHTPAGLGSFFQQAPGDPYFETLATLGTYYFRVNRTDSAAEAAREVRRRWPREPGRLYHAAREFARCAKAAPDPESGRKYGEEAVDTLRLAAGRGFRDAALLKRDDADWAALKDHPGMEPIRHKIREPQKK